MLGTHQILRTTWDNTVLDIRTTGNGRWYDQKVTPDILAVICDVIVSYCNDSGQNSFTKKDLWNSDAFNKIMRHDFGKPSPKNPGSSKEYDKVVGQPVNVLFAAKILSSSSQSSRPQTFKVVPEFCAALNKLAGNEKEAVEFLAAYIKEVIRQSDLHKLFDDFFQRQDSNSFATLKNGFLEFTIEHTGINKRLECNRIFSKVLNIQAYAYHKKGTKRGRLSQEIISLNEIRYNQLNFLDIANRKPKHVPRTQQTHNTVICIESDGATQSRFVTNTIRAVKNHHGHAPEILDQYASTPSGNNAVQGHHIFFRSVYPELSSFRENIIVLSATQHAGHAHAGSHSVSERYQMLCLLKKLDAVVKSENDPNCNFYSFITFKKMLAIVGIIDDKNDVGNEQKMISLLPDDVRRIITEHYMSER